MSPSATGALRSPWTTAPESDDGELARRAAAGDGAAFTTLYDRYEHRAYNLCYRITGSAEDAADATQETFVAVLERLPRLEGRELNFGAYVMTAARNASYDALARRKRAATAGDIPDTAVPIGAGQDPDRPERHALRAAHQEQIRAANASLPPRQREVLALRELHELSYDDVAGIMGMNRNSVAQLISRARINLRDNLRQTALGSVASASPLCERALPLLALRQDDALDDDESAGWLAEHLAGCGTCRVRMEAMEEAGVAYRLWLPLVPALWLRGEAIAHAAERAGARWTAPRRLGRDGAYRGAAGEGEAGRAKRARAALRQEAHAGRRRRSRARPRRRDRGAGPHGRGRSARPLRSDRRAGTRRRSRARRGRPRAPPGAPAPFRARAAAARRGPHRRRTAARPRRPARKRARGRAARAALRGPRLPRRRLRRDSSVRDRDDVGRLPAAAAAAGADLHRLRGRRPACAAGAAEGRRHAALARLQVCVPRRAGTPDGNPLQRSIAHG